MKQVLEVSDRSHEIEFAMFCFYAGTRLATEQGEVDVQSVTADTRLRTADGRVLPAQWLGKSEIETKFADRLHVLPVRIKAGALPDGLPTRDILLSPNHAIYYKGILIQAGALVNDKTIVRERELPERFTYYHVGLVTHELLLAEGLPAESFLDGLWHANCARQPDWGILEGVTPVEELPYPRVRSYRQLPLIMRKELTIPAGMEW